MRKTFHVAAACNPSLHYMVDISAKLAEIRSMVQKGQYFTINRARQYGKTTTLKALGQLLESEYVVVSLDFQKMSHEDFESESTFTEAFAREFLDITDSRWAVPKEIIERLSAIADGEIRKIRLPNLFKCLIQWCGHSSKRIVMIIDEVDSASNYQVFLDFLAQLRGYFIDRDQKTTFHSVILAGVYDVKNLKRKLMPHHPHQFNSPWNIAADFLVDMSFSTTEIAGMLSEYEQDYQTGMDVVKISEEIYNYTSGYPFLVSRICQLIDERVAGMGVHETISDKKMAWTSEGFSEAVKILLSEKNTLFESLIGKLHDYPELKNALYALLFHGQSIVYNPDDAAMDIAVMFGFVKVNQGIVVVSNRIFETRLYNWFLTVSEVQDSDIYRAALRSKNQFIQNGHLNMELVLEKFVTHFDDIYGDREQDFIEADGRRFFLLYLRPIINGTGNYYIESQTRNMERTDIIVDYQGEQFVIEMKIWRGNEYHTRGEDQLSDYLEYYHLKKGYLLSFNFNKKKTTGVKSIQIGDKVLVEAVV